MKCKIEGKNVEKIFDLITIGNLLYNRIDFNLKSIKYKLCENLD